MACKGSWIFSARNIIYNGDVLKCELRSCNGSWIKNILRFNPNYEYSNNNGRFNYIENVIPNNTILTTQKNKIPKNIYQTFSSFNLPNEIKTIIKNNKKICFDYNFIFYDDNDCKLFIKNNFDKNTYKAYMGINNVYGAMKSDFFRYCILYKKGGIYLDIKSIIKYPLNKIIHKNDDCLLDILRSDYEPWRINSPTYEQWILIFAPEHPYLLEVINKMVYYINQKYEPTIENIKNLTTKQKILHVTGPDMFSKCINNYLINNKSLHRNIDYTKFFQIRNSFDYEKMYIMNGKKHYDKYSESLYK